MRTHALALASSLALVALTSSTALAQQKIQVLPSPVNCGGAKINMAAAPVAVTVSNIGNAALNVTGFSVTGTNSADFVIQGAPNPPIKLNPGTNFNFNIVFTPSVCAMRSATLNVVSDDPMKPTTMVALSGYCGNPQIMVDTGTIAFGNQRVGLQSQASTVTITNTGLGDLHVTMITLTGANTGDFILNPMALPGTIQPMSSQKFTVAFKPTMLGARAANVMIASDGNNGMNTTNNVGLLGTGTMANLAVSPLTLDFATQRVYLASSPKTVTISNTGNDAANVTAVQFSGAMGNWFAESSPPPFPAKVPAGGNLVLNVVAVPLMLGAGSGTMTIVFDDPMTPQAQVPLSVTGVGSMIDVSPNFADFGAVPLNMPSAPQTITVTNKGTDTLTISSFMVNGMDATNFTVTNPLVPPVMLAPNMSKSFDVVFQPVVQMEFNATVDLMTDDPQAKLVKIPLSGMGTQAGINVSPMTVTFASVPVGAFDGPKTVTITNSGGQSLTVSTVALSGTNANEFQVDQMGPFTIGAGKSQDLRVTFSPTMAGAAQANLTITPMGLQPVIVSLKGSGLAPSVQLAGQGGAALLDFMMVSVGTTSGAMSVGMRNGGTGSVTVSAIASNDPVFTVDTTGTAMTLTGGQVTTFNVFFAPTAVGMKSGAISVTLQGQTTPATSIMAVGEGVMKTSRSGGGCGIAPTATPIALALLLGCVALALATRRARRR